MFLYLNAKVMCLIVVLWRIWLERNTIIFTRHCLSRFKFGSTSFSHFSIMFCPWPFFVSFFNFFLFGSGSGVSFRSMERLTCLCCILLVFSFCLFSIYVWLQFLDQIRREKGNHLPSAEN